MNTIKVGETINFSGSTWMLMYNYDSKSFNIVSLGPVCLGQSWSSNGFRRDFEDGIITYDDLYTILCSQKNELNTIIKTHKKITGVSYEPVRPKIEDVTVSQGDRFTIDNIEYILSAIDINLACLINLRTGSRKTYGIKVNNLSKITYNEFVQIVGMTYSSIASIVSSNPKYKDFN